MAKRKNPPARQPTRSVEDVRLDVFITWARDRGRRLAEELEQFVRRVTLTKPWISPNTAKGADWPRELSGRLAHARAGIVCLTPESMSDPWVLFEAGALTQKPSDRVWTVLLDLKPSDVPPPLGLRQHTEIADQKDFYKLIVGINATTDSPHRPDDLLALFEKFWPDLEKSVAAIRAMAVKDGTPLKRPDYEVLAEILGHVRDTGGATAGRIDKILHLVRRLHERLLNEPAPALEAMRMADGPVMAELTSDDGTGIATTQTLSVGTVLTGPRPQSGPGRGPGRGPRG